MRAILTHAAITVAPLDAAKQWLAISGARDDALLTDLLASALRLCEAFTGSFPLPTTLREDLAASTRWQKFASHPITAITGVEAIGADNSRRPLAPDSSGARAALASSAPPAAVTALWQPWRRLRL